MAVKEGIDLANSYAYSDSITDLPMLELVGNPVAVNPDRELTRVAREREWDMRWFQHPVRLRDRVPVPPKGPTLAAGTAAAAVGTGIALYVWLRRRALGLRLSAGADTRAQAVRTFLAMAAPSAMTTSSNKIFFTGDLLPRRAGPPSVAPAPAARPRTRG